MRLDSSRRICVTGQTPTCRQTRTCRRELPIALMAVPKSYLTGEIPGSLTLNHVMSGTGDLNGGTDNRPSGIAWFRGIKVNFSGTPIATASAQAEGGSSSISSGAMSSSNSLSSSTSSSDGNSHGGDKPAGHHGGGKPDRGKH